MPFIKFIIGFALGLVLLSPALAQDEYLVKKGNNLTWIAKQFKVGREAVILVNEDLLKTNYEQRCGKRSKKFRTRTEPRSAAKGGNFYCNDGKRKPYANTINPGLRLVIPTAVAPVSIDRTVSEIKGERIAVVIDETGSTSNKRQMIGQFYLAALHKHARKITGIWLYSGRGRIRKIDAVGVTDLSSVMQNRGGFENTHEALREAAKDRPDVIILITDEEGDDWDWKSVSFLPPVVAHCVYDPSYGDCRKTLQRLATETRGRYVEGLLDSPTATRP